MLGKMILLIYITLKPDVPQVRNLILILKTKLNRLLNVITKFQKLCMIKIYHTILFTKLYSNCVN